MVHLVNRAIRGFARLLPVALIAAVANAQPAAAAAPTARHLAGYLKSVTGSTTVATTFVVPTVTCPTGDYQQVSAAASISALPVLVFEVSLAIWLIKHGVTDSVDAQPYERVERVAGTHASFVAGNA
jgi:hypothetical protein